jgi:hypothetical protein
MKPKDAKKPGKPYPDSPCFYTRRAGGPRRFAAGDTILAPAATPRDGSAPATALPVRPESVASRGVGGELTGATAAELLPGPPQFRTAADRFGVHTARIFPRRATNPHR